MKEQLSFPMAIILLVIGVGLALGGLYSQMWLYAGYVYAFGLIVFSWCI